ncbi:MAG: H/ACA RNA-protein complex protein Gar1 [Crenarchaeota archaeon]|nr:H/ACA RNA-protein complex protein Gar1 [Thermoproteota archaeon]
MQRLELLGRVLHRTHNGYVVVDVAAPERLPPLGVPVYTEDRKRVGVLLDIIGPVKKPYAVVKPDSPELNVEKGTPLYYRKPRPPQRKRGRRTRGGGGARGARGRRK